jgi:DNA-binding CsgD family transcriptional regulator
MREELPLPALEVTERQREVLRLVGNGFTGPEIVDELHISLRTVNDHKKKLFTNLSVRNENELIRVGTFLKIINENEVLIDTTGHTAEETAAKIFDISIHYSTPSKVNN